MTDVVVVRLLRSYGAVNAGEVAGYPRAEAERLIAAGVAELFTAPSPETADADQPWREHRAVLRAPRRKG